MISNRVQMVWQACAWEATARKVGNVNRYRDFEDTKYIDFLSSAFTVAPILGQNPSPNIGQLILDAVVATNRAVGKNTNLGIILMLAPLCHAWPQTPNLILWNGNVKKVLAGTTVNDCCLVYQAIRVANPGGLGKANKEDVRQDPEVTLIEAMRFAAKNDQIAEQYHQGFNLIFGEGLDHFHGLYCQSGSLETAISGTHLYLMSRYPDTLIQRKCGIEIAQESAIRARLVLENGWPNHKSSWKLWLNLDDWLRADSNRRNPGTTADLIAAILFVALGLEIISSKTPLEGGGISFPSTLV